MAVTKTVLIVKFDFTRFGEGFGRWHNTGQIESPNSNLLFHIGAQADSSFVNGVLICESQVNQEDLVAENQRYWSADNKQYAIFKAYDRKNDRNAELSCAPTALASYFDIASPLPYQITPAFFKPAVLQKYRADPEKYTLENRSVSSRAGWCLKTFDVNEAKQVHTYLGYLGDLPFTEQQYWLSFNEWPKGQISARAQKTDIEGSFESIADPLIDLKAIVQKFDDSPPDWWLPRGGLASSVQYPHTTSPEEWALAILAFDQWLIEGFLEKPIRKRIEATGAAPDDKIRSVRLIQAYSIAKGMSKDDSLSLVQPLLDLHYLRTKVKGHGAEKDKKELVKAARKKNGSLSAHFRDLTTQCLKSFDEIAALLNS